MTLLPRGAPARVTDCHPTASSGEATDREWAGTPRQKKQEIRQKGENVYLYVYTDMKQRKKKGFSKLSSAVLMEILRFG